MGIGRQNKDLHMFNMIAVENRIPAFHLANDKPVAKYATFNMQELLPSVIDNAQLRTNWIQLVGGIFMKYFPQLAWMAPYLQKTIAHPYLREAKKKSKVVCTSMTSSFRISNH